MNQDFRAPHATWSGDQDDKSRVTGDCHARICEGRGRDSPRLLDLASAFHEVWWRLSWSRWRLLGFRWGLRPVALTGARWSGGRLGLSLGRCGWLPACRSGPWRAGRGTKLVGGPQPRSGRARSRLNARASAAAQGQERCSRRIVRRAWRTTLAATRSSR